MKQFFKNIAKFARTRKFWTAIAGTAVTYLTVKYGQSAELTLLTGLLTALGVYGLGNDK